ncbi:MAG TPA: type II toxin-antitoxin system VapC family toxin [Methylococcaceae bacterium]|nr:type II toxin-antitoxin system VapC family toxin [Methylococcaceae bacterium]
MAVSTEIVLDTSALIAVLANEAEAADMLRALTGPQRLLISAASKTELLIVIESRLGPAGVAKASQLLAVLGVETVPVDDALADLAADALFRWGKGRHPARLNFGDSFAYALAKQLNAPLLFKGNDFSHTDLQSALL